MLNRPEYLEAVLAANALGAIAVPVNFRMTVPEVAFLVRDSGARVVVADTTLAPLAAAVRAETGSLELSVTVGGETTGDTLGYEELISEVGTPRVPLDVPDDTPALVMYTSGTTGRPKGAVLTHSNMEAQALTVSVRSSSTAPTTSGSARRRVPHRGAGVDGPELMLGLTTVIYPVGAFDPGALSTFSRRSRSPRVPRPGAVAGGMRGAAGATAKAEVARHLLGCGARLGHRASGDGRDVPRRVQRRGVRADRDVADHLRARR